jgi:lipopolysaccharide export system protein LptA
MLYETIKQTDDVMDGSVPAANFAKDSPGKSKQPANGPTVIHARDSVYTADTHLAVFEHKVVLNNTTANIICDKLTATMRRGGPNKAPATPPPAPVGSQRKALAAPPGSKAIEHAVAEGNVQVTMDKVDDNGNITHSVGHGKKMDYDGATGRIVLYGRPDIQQGRNLCEATAESTVLTLNRDSSMEANGPHRTVITQEAAESDSTGGKTAPK